MKKLLLITLLLPVHVYAVTTTTAIGGDYDILADVNIYRAKYNLAPLEKDETLCALAKIRAEQIKSDWSHKQFQAEIDKIPKKGGVFYENLARVFDPEDVVWGWSMSQSGHREAMLVPDMKYGCVVQSGIYYSFEGYIPEQEKL